MVLLDTPYDDRHPAIAELSDGTLVYSLFTAVSKEMDSEEIDPSRGPRSAVVRSFDGGRIWENRPHRLPSGFLMEAPTDFLSRCQTKQFCSPVMEKTRHSIAGSLACFGRPVVVQRGKSLPRLRPTTTNLRRVWFA